MSWDARAASAGQDRSVFTEVAATTSPPPHVEKIAGKRQQELNMELRKTVTLLEEINSEYGARANPPLRRVAIAAVFKNPLAGKAPGADLAPLIEASLE